MQQHTLSSSSASRPKKHKRRGRGDTFAGRGVKGQKSRVGGRSKFTAGFEGGQISFLRRLPKLGGFRNPNRVPNQIVKLADLTKLTAAEITPEVLLKAGLIKKIQQRVKILGQAKLTKKLQIKVDAASKTAITAIEAAGGTIELTAKKKKKPTTKK